MAKVDSNVISLNFARESTAGTKPTTGYRAMEPNTVSTFGAQITTTAREPISDTLQRRKGSETDLDAPCAFAMDLTVDAFDDWIEAALFSSYRNKAVQRIASSAVVADGFTVATLTSGAQGLLLYSAGNWGSLLWSDGFATAANNGLQEMSGAIGATKITAGTGRTTETRNGRVSLAGIRVTGAAAGVSYGYSSTTKRGTLTKTGLGSALHGKGLYYGQIVHIGSVASVGGALQKGIRAADADAGNYGFARYVAHTANTLVFDRIDSADLRPNSAITIGANVDVDITFGDFVENVARSDTLYSQRSHTIEQVSPDLFAVGSDGYEYAVGQVVQTLTLNFPLSSNATMDVALIGTDVERPTSSRQTGASTAVAPDRNEAMNTTADFARLRLTGVDDVGVDSDFKSLTLTINPQTTAEKVIGKLGAQYINRGNLLVDITTQVIFASDLIPKTIRDNATVRFDMILSNDDGVICIECPSQTIGGGGREYPANQAVLINATAESFEDEDFGTSIMVSTMPVPIPTD